MFFRKLGFVLVAGVLGSLSLFAQTTSTVTRQFTTSPFGLGSTETARISVVNVASNSSGGTAASCTGNISFLNSTGATIGSATNFTAASGQIVSVSLPFAQSGGSGVRTEMRGEISQTFTRDVPCSLQYSLETFDTGTGATHIYVTSSTPSQVGGFGH